MNALKQCAIVLATMSLAASIYLLANPEEAAYAKSSAPSTEYRSTDRIWSDWVKEVIPECYFSLDKKEQLVVLYTPARVLKCKIENGIMF